MEKLWLKSYPEGVPADINLDACGTIPDLFDAKCQEFSQRDAYANYGKTITFRQLHQYSTAFAAYLQNNLKLSPGSRVAIMVPNVMQYPVAVYGILKAGMVVTNVNPMYTARELEHQLNDSGAETILIFETSAHILADIIKKTPVKHVIIARIGDMLGSFKGGLMNFMVKQVKKAVTPYNLPQAVYYKDAIKPGNAHQYKPVKLDRNDLAFLQYTGGTTGVAKGAMLSHLNITANLDQTLEYIQNVLSTDKPEVIFTPLPMYHVFSLTCNCLMSLKTGGINILITDPRDMKGFIKEMKRWPITVLTGVNTLFNGLINHPDFASVDFSTWRLVSAGGMAVQKNIAERWKALTNIKITEGYGLTETSPCATSNPSNLPDWNGTIGLPFPSTNIAIRDDNDQDVALGERGEICIQGPQVMQGYWQRESATQEVMSDDHYFRSGDIGVMNEDGFIKIVDRKKDMILVSGFNVYPNEIEDVLASHPDILEVACIGVPDEQTTEAVKVFIVTKSGQSIDIKALKAYCRENLTGYKVPRHFEFIKELPKSNVGKILRRELR